MKLGIGGRVWQLAGYVTVNKVTHYLVGLIFDFSWLPLLKPVDEYMASSGLKLNSIKVILDFTKGLSR